MSAAEKLKALVDGFFEGTEPSGYEAPREVILALPQIVAVVEAAEMAADPERWDKFLESGPAALSALDEALNNGAETPLGSERT